MANILFHLDSLYNSKIPLVNSLWDTRYMIYTPEVRCYGSRFSHETTYDQGNRQDE